MICCGAVSGLYETPSVIMSIMLILYRSILAAGDLQMPMPLLLLWPAILIPTDYGVCTEYGVQTSTSQGTDDMLTSPFSYGTRTRT